MPSPRSTCLSRALVILCLSLFTFVLVLGGCSSKPDVWQNVPGAGKRVLVSFPPLYCFTKNVAGDHARVLCVATVEDPHDYKIVAGDALKAKRAELFIVNGLGLDGFMGKIRNSSGNDKTRVVDLGEALEEENHDLLIHSTGEKESGHAGHHHGEHDPHIWLGIEQAKAMVEIIAKELSKADPEHKEAFHKNAAAYLKQLDELHQHGKNKLAGKKNKKIVAMHDSMQYFAKSFGLELVGFLMPQPGVEADNKKMQELAKKCTDINGPVRVITAEPQFGDKGAEALIDLCKVELKKQKRLESPPVKVNFDTLETAPTRDFAADFYITKMRENIDNLAENLK